MTPDGQTPGIGADLAGETLQVGDWIQSNGTNWLHVASDLLSKLRGDRLYGLLPWQDGNWEQGSLVYYNQHIYRARTAIQTGDASPSTPTNPVTINGSQYDGAQATIADVEAWMAATPATAGNVGRWVISTAAGTINIPGGGTLVVAAGDTVLNTGDVSYATRGYANAGAVTLPPLIAAHDIAPTTDVGPIATPAAMSGFPAPSVATAGEWAQVTAAVNAPTAAGSGAIPAGSTIMVLENANQGTGGYHVVRASGGTPIIQNPGTLGGQYPGVQVTLGSTQNVEALLNGPMNYQVGSWWAITSQNFTTSAFNNNPVITGSVNVGNLVALTPFGYLDALVLVNPVGPVWAKVPAGANPAGNSFVGVGGPVTQLNAQQAPTPPAAFRVQDYQPAPTTPPTYTFTPTATGSKWDEVKLESGIISINDESELPRTPPTEDTLIFIAHSQRMKNNPAIFRWDVATGTYIDIVARAEHPINLYPDVATMQASAPTLPHSIGYAIAEGRWGYWTGSVQAGQQGTWAVDEYWSTIKGNMAWKQQAYFANAIVYYAGTNSFYRATQSVPAATLNPNDPTAAPYWQQIGGGSSGGSGTRVFFGAGDFDADPYKMNPAGNWGMPAGTFPQGIQPQNGDAYFDRLSGTIVKFTVTQNPTVNFISGHWVKADHTSLGTTSIGPVTGRPDLLNFAQDGDALGYATGDYFGVNIPGVTQITTFSTGPNYEEWDSPLMWNQPPNTVPIGHTILITDPLGAAIPAQPNFPLSGTYYPQGTGLVWTNLPWLDGPDGSGHFIRSGWMVVPGLNAGSQYSVTPVVRPTQGAFAGTTITGGTKAIIWTGDSTADQGGWVIVDDAATVDWQLGTPNPRPQADTVTGTVEWGTVRHFDVVIPAGVNDNDIRTILTGFTQDTQLIRCEIRDTRANGSVYEFNIMISQGVQPLLSPIAAIANNPMLKEINILRNAGGTYLVVKLKPEARTQTLRVTLTSNDQHLDTIRLDWQATSMPSNPSINAEKNYPETEQLKNELIAASASADIQVPQWFSRSSIVKNVNQTAFSLGVKPKRYLKAKFMAYGGADSNSWPQIIAQLNGGWISWQLHNRGDVIVENNDPVNGFKVDVKNDMAADNSGLYVSEATRTSSHPVWVTVEVNFYKEHTALEVMSHYRQTDNVFATYRTSVIYNESWQDQLNFIGYKNTGKTFSYLEAYIQWE